MEQGLRLNTNSLAGPGLIFSSLLQGKRGSSAGEGCVLPPLLHHGLCPLHLSMQLLITGHQTQPLPQNLAVVLLPVCRRRCPTARGSRGGSGEPGKPGQVLERGWRGPKCEAAVAAFPPVPTDPSHPGYRADGLKHPRGSISPPELQKQEDNPVPFSWVLGPALAARRARSREGTGTGRCFAGSRRADPLTCSAIPSVLLFKAGYKIFTLASNKCQSADTAAKQEIF